MIAFFKTPAGRYVLLGLKIMISAGLLYFIFSLVDLQKTLDAAIGANVVLLVLAAAVRGLVLCFDALRLHWMSPVDGLPYHQHLRLALRGAFFSQIGFGFLTGDAYRAAGYAKGSGNFSGPAAQLLAARLAGIAMTAMIALIAALYLITGHNDAVRGFATKTGICIVIAASAVAVLLWLTFKVLPRHVPDSVQNKLVLGTRALRSLSPRIWLVSLLVILLRGFSLWLVFSALHHSISYFVPLLASVTGTLITLLPLAFSGLGLREGAIAGVSALFGAPAALSVSAAILLRMAVLSAASTGLVVSLFMPELSKKTAP